jgi:hypothetical protein
MWQTTARWQPMAIRASTLIEFLKTFPDNAIVRGFEDGLSVKDADGTGEVVMLNDRIPAKSTPRSRGNGTGTEHFRERV